MFSLHQAIKAVFGGHEDSCASGESGFGDLRGVININAPNTQNAGKTKSREGSVK